MLNKSTMLDKTVNTPEYLDIDKQIYALTDRPKCIDFEIVLLIKNL